MGRIVVLVISYRAPTQSEFLEFRTALVDLLWTTTWRLADRDDESRPDSPGAATLEIEDLRGSYLALLNTIGVANAVLEELDKEAARRAGQMGAGYPALASAWKVTRQGARRRWPDAVITLDDGPVRKAMAEAVAGLSNASLQPETSARMFQPMIQAAGTRDASLPGQVLAAAKALLAVPPPEPADADVVVPLLDALDEAVKAFEASMHPTPEPNQWQRFLDEPQSE